MAAVFAQHHCDTRQAGQLYAAWRGGSPVIRQRLLDEPTLFFKAQRQAEPKTTAAPVGELLRDLEMAAAIVNRATRRLAGCPLGPAAAEMDGQQREAARRQIERLKPNFAVWPGESHRSKNRMLSQAQRTTILELSAQGVSQHEIARMLGISRPTVPQSSAIKLDYGPRDSTGRESRTLPATDLGAFQYLQGESRASP